MNMSAMAGIQGAGMAGGMSGCSSSHHSQMTNKKTDAQTTPVNKAAIATPQNLEPGLGNKIDIIA